ncbi:hypothetical protein Tco_1485346 [Tanacetum coccineum]
MLEANAELSKDVLGQDLPEQDFAKRMVDMIRRVDKLVQQIDTFVPINLEATKAKLKRYGEELQTKTSKKQKIDDKDVPAIGEKVAESKKCLSDNKSKGGRYIYRALDLVSNKDFTREDLIELYRLVMQKYGTNRPEDAYDRVLWSDLRTMFDPPLIEDAIWSLPLQQKMESFDVIMGMDWFSKRKFVIVCHEKVVRIPLEGEEILRVHGEHTQRVVKTLMNTKVDLVHGATLVAKPPYRLAPSEMQELSKQLQYSFEASVGITEEGEVVTYLRFIVNFSKIVKPHTSLTERNQKYEWDVEREEAFQTLKNDLYDASINRM